MSAMETVSKSLRWFVTDPKTGKVVIAQMPNLPIWIFIAAAVGRQLTHGVLHGVFGVIATVSLIIWAVLEVVSGQSPFRRALGAVVLVGQIVLLVLRIAS